MTVRFVLSNGAKWCVKNFLTEINFNEHIKCEFNRIDFIALNNVLMLPRDSIFLEQV